MLRVVKKYQPVDLTGAVEHCYFWATSPTHDVVYQNPRYKPKEGVEPVAIYCTHGTADQLGSFTKVARRLIAAELSEDIQSIHLVAFKGRCQGQRIENFSVQLINQILAKGHKRVILLGHSRGGVVNTFAAEYLAQRDGIEVEMVINICAPFSGSYLALPPLTWISSSVRDMQTDCKFLQNLQQKVVDSPVKYHFFVAEKDAIVLKNAGYVREYVDAHPNSLMELDRHGHLSIMSSHRLVSKIEHLVDECLLSRELTEKEQEENGEKEFDNDILRITVDDYQFPNMM